MVYTEKRDRGAWLFGGAAIAGATGFVVIVVILHVLQRGYDPVHQLMSELALGPQGWLMAAAFGCIGISAISIQFGLRSLGAPMAPRVLLAAGGISFIGAGILTLRNAAMLHVALIASAFMLLVPAMYLVPRKTPGLKASSSRIVSWSLAAGTAFSAALGDLVPMGIAQRMAATCILIWLVWVGRSIFRDGRSLESARNVRNKEVITGANIKGTAK